MTQAEKIDWLKACGAEITRLLEKQKTLLSVGKGSEASRVAMAIRIAKAEFKRVSLSLRHQRSKAKKGQYFYGLYQMPELPGRKLATQRRNTHLQKVRVQKRLNQKQKL